MKITSQEPAVFYSHVIVDATGSKYRYKCRERVLTFFRTKLSSWSE